MRIRLQKLNRAARPAGTLDVDHRRFAERDIELKVVRQRGLDDLFLDFAVERHIDFLPGVILPQVDERVLLGELIEGDPEPGPVGGVPGDDD